MEREWRCMQCGAHFAQHFSFCTGCWNTGQIVAVPHRTLAALDFQPGISTARDVARMAWGSVVQEAYPALRIGVRSLVLMSGGPGDGKSTMASRLSNAVPGPALLAAFEEGVGPALAARLGRCGVKRGDFHIITRATVDQVVAAAVSLKAQSLVIDSVQECAWSADELRHVLGVIPTLAVLVGVVQITKSGVPAGAMALQHECDVHIVVEAMQWRLVKSRFQPLDAVGAVLPSAGNSDAGPALTAMPFG